MAEHAPRRDATRRDSGHQLDTNRWMYLPQLASLRALSTHRMSR
jgi:hypothetical protein